MFIHVQMFIFVHSTLCQILIYDVAPQALRGSPTGRGRCDGPPHGEPLLPVLPDPIAMGGYRVRVRTTVGGLQVICLDGVDSF